MPFRFPREMVIVLIIIAVLWEIVAWMVPPYVVPGWGRIPQQPRRPRRTEFMPSRSGAWPPRSWCRS